MTPQTATLVALSQMSIVITSQPVHSMTHALQGLCGWLKGTASIFELDLSLISHISTPTEDIRYPRPINLTLVPDCRHTIFVVQ